MQPTGILKVNITGWKKKLIITLTDLQVLIGKRQWISKLLTKLISRCISVEVLDHGKQTATKSETPMQGEQL